MTDVGDGGGVHHSRRGQLDVLHVVEADVSIEQPHPRWADCLNPMPKWIASSTLTGPLEWNSTLLDRDLAEQIRALKADQDGDLISSGMGSFARYLVAEGLVDELYFWVHPSIEGAGERPFHGAKEPSMMRHDLPNGGDWLN